MSLHIRAAENQNLLRRCRPGCPESELPATLQTCRMDSFLLAENGALCCLREAPGASQSRAPLFSRGTPGRLGSAPATCKSVFPGGGLPLASSEPAGPAASATLWRCGLALHLTCCPSYTAQPLSSPGGWKGSSLQPAGVTELEGGQQEEAGWRRHSVWGQGSLDTPKPLSQGYQRVTREQGYSCSP